MYFICMIKKAVKSNIAESGRSNIIFINTFLCWICFVFLAKTGQCKRRHFGYSDISFIFHCNVWNYLALEYMLCDFVYIASKYVGRYWMFIWNCHWTYIKSGKFIFRKSGIVFFQLLWTYSINVRELDLWNACVFYSGAVFICSITNGFKEKRIDYEY